MVPPTKETLTLAVSGPSSLPSQWLLKLPFSKTCRSWTFRLALSTGDVRHLRLCSRSRSPAPRALDEGTHAHPIRGRAGRPARRCPAIAAGVRRVAQTGRAKARPGETRADLTGHGAGSRGICAA